MLARNPASSSSASKLSRCFPVKSFALGIVRPNGDNRRFGRVRRSAGSDVYVVWSEYDSPSALDKGSNPHASYHRDGRLHSKTYDRATIVKQLQAPGKAFRGNQPIEATNADRALSSRFPRYLVTLLICSRFRQNCLRDGRTKP